MPATAVLIRSTAPAPAVPGADGYSLWKTSRGDAAAVISLLYEGYPEGFDPNGELDICSYVATPRGTGRACGYVCCRQHWGMGRLYLLAVAREHRNRGVGTALVHRCLHWLHRNHYERACIVLPADHSAVPFARRVGFEEPDDQTAGSVLL